jgi:hypothetical protein
LRKYLKKFSSSPKKIIWMNQEVDDLREKIPPAPLPQMKKIALFIFRLNRVFTTMLDSRPYSFLLLALLKKKSASERWARTHLSDA